MCMIRLDVLVPCALLSAVAAGAGPYHCPPSCPAQAQPVAALGPGQTLRTQSPSVRAEREGEGRQFPSVLFVHFVDCCIIALCSLLISVTQKSSSHSELTISW